MHKKVKDSDARKVSIISRDFTNLFIRIRGICQFRVDLISREVARGLNRIQRDTLDMMKSTKIAPARFRRLAASVHRSIYPSIRLLCPSKPNAKDDASSSGGRQSRAGCRSRRMQFRVRSFVRSPLPTRSPLQNEHWAILDSVCDDQQHLRDVARGAAPWVHAKSMVRNDQNRKIEISRPGSL